MNIFKTYKWSFVQLSLFCIIHLATSKNVDLGNCQVPGCSKCWTNETNSCISCKGRYVYIHTHSFESYLSDGGECHLNCPVDKSQMILKFTNPQNVRIKSKLCIEKGRLYFIYTENLNIYILYIYIYI